MNCLTLAMATLALAPLDRAEVELADGSEVHGPVSAIRPGLLVIHVGDGVHVEVPLDDVISVRIDGEALSKGDLQAATSSYLNDRYGPADQASPAPWAVATASILVPGGGQALLGDREGFRRYLVASAIADGLGFFFWRRGLWPQTLSLLVLDSTFRFYSAGEAWAEASERQRLQR